MYRGLLLEKVEPPFKMLFFQLFRLNCSDFRWIIFLYIYIEDYVWKRLNLLKLKCYFLRLSELRRLWIEWIYVCMHVHVSRMNTWMSECVYKRLNPLKSIMPFSKAVWISDWRIFESSRCIEDYVRNECLAILWRLNSYFSSDVRLSWIEERE